MAKKTRRKASKSIGARKAHKAAPRKRASRKAAPRKVARVSRRTYRIGAVSSPRRKTSKSMKGSSMMKRVTGAAMVGAGVIGGQYLHKSLSGTITNPYMRAGALFVGGVLLGGMSPALAGLGMGVAASGVVNIGAQLLPGLPAPSQVLNGRVGALSAREMKMIESAAKGTALVNGTDAGQSGVLTGLYDTENVLA